MLVELKQRYEIDAVLIFLSIFHIDQHPPQTFLNQLGSCIGSFNSESTLGQG